MDYDENNPTVTAPLARSMVLLVPGHFPASLLANASAYSRFCAAADDLPVASVTRLMLVVEQCMGPLYVRHKGPDWKAEKLQEMAESGLVYVWYAVGDTVGAFVSFKLVVESYGQALYLYEIQVVPQCQHQQWGAQLMLAFHEYALALGNSKGDTALAMSIYFGAVATGLTVFSDNERALAWYKKMGYKLTADSPRDKKLRGSPPRVLRPSFYLLSRPI